jgi:hypothetical protein
MSPRRKDYELSVEQELPAAPDGAPRRTRLTVRFSGESDETPPDETELARSIRELSERLARAAEASGVGAASRSERTDRPLEELLETYRPRQIELVELLHADGELTDGEYETLRSRVSEPTPAVPLPRPASPAPGAVARTPGRSVEELLRTYQITSLRQAGAVRARRQISFDEYMSLKRHFAGAEQGTPDPGPTS